MKKILSTIAGMLFASVSFAGTPVLFNDYVYPVNGGTFSNLSPNTFYSEATAYGAVSGTFQATTTNRLIVNATLCADVNPNICRVINDTFITVTINPDGSRIMKRVGESKLFNVNPNGVLPDGAGSNPTLSILDMDGKAGYVLVVSQ